MTANNGATVGTAALGTTAGNSVQPLLLGTNTGNNSRVQVDILRHTNGGDWTTATTRLQQFVDWTPMAYVDFNPPGETQGLALGVGTDTGNPVEVVRFKRNGADLVRPYTGFSYNSYSSQHVAFTKKAGTYSYYFRKSDTGASDGPNLSTLFEVRDNGDTWQPGEAQSGLQRVLNNYAQAQWMTDTGRGWRAISESHGTTHGPLVFQGTTDNYTTSFINALKLLTNGDVEMPGGVLTGQRLEINKFATADSFGYIDICAQPGSDADTRLWREPGANGGFFIQNGGSGNLGFYCGGTAGQPWTANKGFHINGSNGTLYLTSGLALENNQALYFRDAGGSYPYMLTQGDNNWVFYGTNSVGNPRGIFSCFMRSDTSAFEVKVPLLVQGQPVGGSGSIVQTVSVQSATMSTMTAVMAANDTSFYFTDGTQILNVNITPRSASNSIRVRVSLCGSINASGAAITVAVFGANQAYALHTVGTTVPTANYMVNINCEFTHSPNTTSAVNYFVRVGPSSGTLTLNGVNGVRRYGGDAKYSMVLEEIRA